MQYRKSRQATSLCDELIAQLWSIFGQVLSLAKRGWVFDGGTRSWSRSTWWTTRPGSSQATTTSAQGRINIPSIVYVHLFSINLVAITFNQLRLKRVSRIVTSGFKELPYADLMQLSWVGRSVLTVAVSICDGNVLKKHRGRASE